MTEQKPVAGRIALILVVIGLLAWAFLRERSPAKPWGMALGQDLRGGTTLRFHLDLEGARRAATVKAGEADEEVVGATLRLLETRINRYGLAEVNLTALGDARFEISVPAEVDAEAIQKVVEALGELQFRIEVRPFYEPFESRDGDRRTREQVWMGAKGAVPGPDGKPEEFGADADGFRAFKEREVARFKEFRDRGERYEPLDPRYRLVPRQRDEHAAPPSTPADFVVLEEPANKAERLGGDILSAIRASADRGGNPAVTFDVKLEYQNVFSAWTGANVGLPMAIVLNGQFDSAPIIQSPLRDQVQVTLGGGFAMGEDADARYRELLDRQKHLIATLQSGSLQVTPRFEAKSRVGPTLAGEAVRRGLLSVALAFVLVLVYMAVFYRRAGLFADVALLLNLVLLVGAMAFLKGTLTLPGIAGIVLTLGMAVDANILIFERLREELKRGRSNAQAVSEGFDRAFTTIIDSNVTTLLTAAFLYAFGTGAIQGFAVTLFIGLVASMFTAVYVVRTCFELWLRNPAAKIRFLGEARVPSISWMGMRGKLIPISVALVAASALAFVASPDRKVYDIDFTGGMKLQARFNQRLGVDDVKRALDGGVQEVRVRREGAPVGSGEMKSVRVGPFGNAEVVAVRSEGRWVELRHPLLETGGPEPLTESEQLDAFRAYVEQVFGSKLLPPWVAKRPVVFTSTTDDDPFKEVSGGLRFTIAIEDPANALSPAALEAALARMPFFTVSTDGGRREAQPASNVRRVVKVLDAGRPEGGEARLFDVGWKATQLSDPSAPAEHDPATLQSDLREFLSGAGFRQALIDGGVPRRQADDVVLADPFPVNDLVGPGVARRMRNDALLALLVSLVGIILYVAFRFRSYAMGFAAVLCLAHDVLVALGAVVLVNHLGVVDARINLGLVAAFLTIVGFSVNDTVVTFDRIRELRGKAPNVTVKMIDDAVNQTLARTIRTSLTLFLTLVVLFAVNWGQRSLLEGFSFTMLAGTIAGVYSTVAVAAPLLLFLPWFWNRIRAWRPRGWTLTWPIVGRRGLALAGVALAVTVAVGLAKGSWFLGMFFGLILVPVGATLGLFAAWAVGFAVVALVLGIALVIPWTRRKDAEAAYQEARAQIAERERLAEAKAEAAAAKAAAARAAAEQRKAAERKQRGEAGEDDE